MGEATNSDFVPLCLGTPENARVTQHFRPLLDPREGIFFLPFVYATVSFKQCSACILQLLVAGACFVDCIFLRPFGLPMVEHIRLLLYSHHTTALVAYNGGTIIGHGPVMTLFLEPHFVSRAHDIP